MKNNNGENVRCSAARQDRNVTGAAAAARSAAAVGEATAFGRAVATQATSTAAAGQIAVAVGEATASGRVMTVQSAFAAPAQSSAAAIPTQASKAQLGNYLRGALWPTLALVIAIVATTLSGCAASADSPDASATANTTATSATADSASADTTGYDFEYSDADMDASYDATTAVYVTLDGNSASVDGGDLATAGVVVEDGVVKLTADATYVVSGTLQETTLSVEAADDAKPQVVLNGVDISNTQGPAFLVAGADKVFLTLAEGSINTLTDGSGRTDLATDADSSSGSTDEDSTAVDSTAADSTTGGDGTTADSTTTDSEVRDATLFSHDDLTINGSGSLNVSSANADAISSKDDLVIYGGTYEVDAAVDAVKGKDCVKIGEGNLTLSAGDDAVVSSNTDDPTSLGFVSVDGGELNIDAVGDAVHAETVLRLAGGNISVSECNEGFEGAQIWVQDGEHSIVSADDALNATGDVSMEYLLEISGGVLHIDAEGDGVDSNGTIVQTGGEVIVAGPTHQGNGAFDAQSGSEISGGTLLAFSAGGMEQNFGSESTQAAILMQLGQTYSAGVTVALTDESGSELFSHEATKTFSMLNFSSPELVVGDSYTLLIDGQEAVSFTLSEALATVSGDGSAVASTSGGEMGMGGGPQGGGGGGAPQGGVGR